MRADIGAIPVLGLAGEGLGESLAFCLSFDDQLPTNVDHLIGVLVMILRGELIILIGGDLIAAARASIYA